RLSKTERVDTQHTMNNALAQIFGKTEYKESDKEEFKTDLKSLHKHVKENDLKRLKKMLALKRAKYLLNAADDIDGQTAIMIAAKSNNSEVFDMLLSSFRALKVDLDHPDKNGNTALHHFFSMDVEPRLLLTLLDQEDVHVNSVNRDLNTPFHYFCQKFKSASAVKEVFDKLVAKSADINATNRNGESPLHKAVFNNALAPTMLTLLLESHANVNITNKNGESCLHYCVRMGRTDLVAILLRYGADKTTVVDNETLFDLAMKLNFTKLADLLRDGVDVNSHTDGSTTELIILLQNPTLREDFRTFLREDLICEENVSFWLDVESFKTMKPDSALRVFKEFYRIYDKYITESSPNEINIPYSIKKEINTFLKSLPPMNELLDSLALLPIANIPPTPSPRFFSNNNTNTNSPILNSGNNNTNTNSNSNNTAAPTSASPSVQSTANPTPNANSQSASPPQPFSISFSTTSTSTQSITSTNNTNTNNPTLPTIPTIITTEAVVATSPTTTSTTPTITTTAAATSSTDSTTITYDCSKAQSIYNTAQQHIFMLMATDSLSKYKKRARKSSSH
ncbi:hypothetical protein SAMD00019534_056700, partial [Acytostelium subglobosum LB1]|uniref:hypothetical protein n=1 Tax=Acytostelium subglobosum LB1 TaxID=1410327 RepID=UPI000644DEC7